MKVKNLEKLDVERNEKVRNEERSLVNAKSKCKLESDKLKEQNEMNRKLNDEINMLKKKLSDYGVKTSGLQFTNNKLTKELKEMESKLKNEHDKYERLKTTNDRQMVGYMVFFIIFIYILLFRQN